MVYMSLSTDTPCRCHYMQECFSIEISAICWWYQLCISYTGSEQYWILIKFSFF